jgi:FtsP/CotA-like multicopper oxidase with cupredoxin domain
MAPPTETPSAGAVEVWQIINLTGDTHPMHFHLVNVQLIQRQAFTGYPGNDFSLVGSPMPPDANEVGWKETVRVNPGEVAIVIMQFNLPTLPSVMGDPLSPRTGGHEYVWHCHILEHEEHDMMRPLVVY